MILDDPSDDEMLLEDVWRDLEREFGPARSPLRVGPDGLALEGSYQREPMGASLAGSSLRGGSYRRILREAEELCTRRTVWEAMLERSVASRAAAEERRRRLIEAGTRRYEVATGCSVPEGYPPHLLAVLGEEYRVPRWAPVIPQAPPDPLALAPQFYPFMPYASLYPCVVLPAVPQAKGRRR